MQEPVSDPGQADTGDDGLRAHGHHAIDRHRDVAAWVTTPVVTLLVGPVVGFCTVAALSGLRTSPMLIDCTGGDNGCYQGQTSAIAHHVVAFLIGWLLLWCLPWWRGLRRVRILVAVLTVLPLVLLPIRLLGMPQGW